MSLDKPSILGRIKVLIKGFLKPPSGGPESDILPVTNVSEVHSAPPKHDGLGSESVPQTISDPIAIIAPSITPSEPQSSPPPTPPSPSLMAPAPIAKPKFLASYCKEIAEQTTAQVKEIGKVETGTEKTTTAVNLASVIAKSGQRVLLSDMDSQGAASFYFRSLGVRGMDFFSNIDMIKLLIPVKTMLPIKL